MDNQITNHGQLPAASARTAEGGNNHGGGNNQATTTGDGGNNGINPEDIVDDVLAVLPVPSRDHIFAGDFGVDFL